MIATLNLWQSQDIIDNIIIEAVGDDSRFLKKCALVSSSLLPTPSHLFPKISLRGDQACQRLHQLLVENPVIQSFVRSIAIDHWDWGYKDCHSPTPILLSLNWNDFSGELKDALSTIVHSSTLKTLCLEKVNVPVYALLRHPPYETGVEFPLDDFDGEQLRLLTLAASEWQQQLLTR